jgi:hypothetical protein
MERSAQDWPESFGSIFSHSTSNFDLTFGVMKYSFSMVTSEVSKTFEDPKFGHRYFDETSFHNSWHELGTSRDTNQISGEYPTMVLLPKILPKVTEASVETLDEFLQVVQDHPLLKYADPADEMYDLYRATAAASEKVLGPELFEVRGYCICIHTTVLLIGISPFCQGLGERRALREAEALRLAAETVVQVEPIVEVQQDALSTHFNVPQSLPPETPPTLRARFGQFLSNWFLNT